MVGSRLLFTLSIIYYISPGSSAVAGPGRGVETPLCECPYIKTRDRCHDCVETSTWEYNQYPRDDNISQALSHKSILFLGDSLAGQLTRAAQCYFTAVADVNISYVGLFSFPISSARPDSVDIVLNRILSQGTYDAVVVSMGTWYNWPRERFHNIVGDRENARDTALAQLQQCPPHVKEKIELYLQSDTSLSSYELSEFIRVHCNVLLNDIGFIHGLLQFAAAVGRHGHRWPTIYWKDIPPQHFPNSPSGMYNGRVNLECTAIHNKTEAYSRNRYADEVVKSLEDRGLLRVIRTWQHDVDKWNSHVHKDCTHYCIPSVVTWNWVDVIIRALGRQGE